MHPNCNNIGRVSLQSVKWERYRQHVGEILRGLGTHVNSLDPQGCGEGILPKKESYEEQTTLGGLPFNQGMKPAELTSQGEKQEIKFFDLALVRLSSFLLGLPVVQVQQASIGHIAY